MTDLLGVPKFPLGDIYTTPGAHELIEQGLIADLYLDRHWRGDWGDIDAEDAELNKQAIKREERLLSSYSTTMGRIWILTEADRSTTTILTPEEY